MSIKMSKQVVFSDIFRVDKCVSKASYQLYQHCSILDHVIQITNIRIVY